MMMMILFSDDDDGWVQWCDHRSTYSALISPLVNIQLQNLMKVNFPSTLYVVKLAASLSFFLPSSEKKQRRKKKGSFFYKSKYISQENS